MANGSENEKREERVNKKEMMNVINTMHHIPATQSGKWVAKLFIAQEIGKSWRNTGS